MRGVRRVLFLPVSWTATPGPRGSACGCPCAVFGIGNEVEVRAFPVAAVAASLSSSPPCLLPCCSSAAEATAFIVDIDAIDDAALRAATLPPSPPELTMPPPLAHAASADPDAPAPTAAVEGEPASADGCACAVPLLKPSCPPRPVSSPFFFFFLLPTQSFLCPAFQCRCWHTLSQYLVFPHPPHFCVPLASLQ